ncbi:seven-hairpin glycosidase [Mycena metata]|uniref:alpha-1,2-Mannosidase n=1 Tax=Mycena metata TaxID=1033252 RepID=A0AAD7I9F5_9AGAR|nr:seven-hairpin glycosidase [Mycena metata]
MRLTEVLNFVAVILVPVFAGPVQSPSLALPQTVSAHWAAVRKMFESSYKAYGKFAWGHDDLLPLSESYSDDRNSWGASICDAMTTMVSAHAFCMCTQCSPLGAQIDTLSVFETTIRYLGSLLSAYELSDKKYPELLDKARELLTNCENNDIPYGFLDFSTNTPVVQISNIAEAGTLTLEWATLSKYTGNDTYRALAENSAKHIASLPAPFPSLAIQGIDPQNGSFVGGQVAAVDSTIRHLLRYSTSRNNNTMNVTYHTSSHLACFHGGKWILGGKLFKNETIVNCGLALVDACINTYLSTVTDIGPETFAYISSGGNLPELTPQDLAFYNQHGFYITDANYDMRPEMLESNFYAWRATGDTKYLENAARVLHSFNRYLNTTGGAFAGIVDVNDVASETIDYVLPCSFWFSEVLKYLYLTFDDPEHISLDEYVFNTEAHPFKAPPAKNI